MDANRYITEIVEPTISDFEANPASVRHAFLACVVTFHSIDYLTYPKRPGNRRKWFQEKSPAFAMVDRIAHALKHVQTGHPQSAHHQPLKVEDVIERPPAIWDKAVWDLSRWGDAVGGVTIKNDHERDLLEIVNRAAEFLRASICEPAGNQTNPEKDLSRSAEGGTQNGNATSDENQSLSNKLDKSGGVIKPAEGVDPQIVQPAPVPDPNSTPVIPPTGTPRGPPGPEPK